MAYIQPTSNIYILKDVPLNPSYDDTITFNNTEAQFNYFSNFAKFQLDNYSVVREKLNTLKVEGDIGRYYDVNYMIFQNNNFSDKWFYAFIVRVEYLNPNTTLITFKLDVMQSWMFDYTILPSLVEREHVRDDSLYANIENEGIEVNERIAFDNPINFEPYIGQKMLVIGSTEDPYNMQGITLNVDTKELFGQNRIIKDFTVNDSDIIILDAGPSTEDTVVTFSSTNKWFRIPLEVNKFSFIATGKYKPVGGSIEGPSFYYDFIAECYGEYDGAKNIYQLSLVDFAIQGSDSNEEEAV